MYRLTRDDGIEIRVTGNVWEAALELAFLYGWRPAGTESPAMAGWPGRPSPPGVPPWDSQDYFSSASQHVGRGDARALAEAILRALLHIPDWGTQDQVCRAEASTATASPVPSQASARANGLSAHMRTSMRRFATFADFGGFTIGSAL